MIKRTSLSAGFFSVTLAVSTTLPACKTSNNTASSGSTLRDATGNAAPALTVPSPATKDNPVNKAAVLAAWKELKKTYYEDGSIYTKGPMPAESEIRSCLGACPDNWSDLACHYYSHTPSYNAVVPNIRGCFTRVARGSVLKNGQRMTYPDVYDYCVFQDFDAVLGRTPPFDQTTIDANKASGNKPGVMKWIDDNQAAVFKYIMFPDGYPFTWNKEQEQETINEFYGVDLQGKTSYTASDKDQVDECNKKRGRTSWDPTDGTHCSYSKISRLREHP
jgi:hypothetical protein